MSCYRLVFIALISLISFRAQAQTQTTSLIGTSEEFILENVKGYASVEERGLEHEEFNVLVFEDKDRELSFFFTFYRGAKICSFIKNKAPIASLKQEIDLIQSNFKKVKDNVWEKPDKSVQVQINEEEGIGVIIVKEIRQ